VNPIVSFVKSDIGLKRENNEDSFLADHSLQLFAVADGMGGMQAGEVASAQTIESLHAAISDGIESMRELAARNDPESRLGLERGMQTAFLRACADVHAVAKKDPRKTNMGSTLIAMLAIGDKAVIGHVGDSRIYLFRGGAVHQLTEDHTLGMEQVRRGFLTEEQVKKLPTRNILLRAIGLQPEVSVDTLVTELYPGDAFLLCSDGLYGEMKNEELLANLSREDLSEAPEALVEIALARGGKDNCTALVLAIRDEEKAAQQVDVRAKADVLRRIPLFEGLSYKDALEVLSISRSFRAEPGEEIIVEGEPGGEFFAIVRGRVKISKLGQDIAELRSGGYFGEMVLFDNSTRSATVTALENCSLIAIERDGMLKLMQRNVELSNRFLWAFGRVMATRLRSTNANLAATKSQLG
jgi:serine/threonine protein phosphatase PrpC